MENKKPQQGNRNYKNNNCRMEILFTYNKNIQSGISTERKDRKNNL